jgi:hypothetical protein
MKTKLLLTAFISCLLFTSCEKDATNIEQDSFETTFQKKGLSEPFSFQYAIKTEEGDLAMLSTKQVMNFMTGKMFNEDLDRELTDYQLLQNPDKDSKEFALMATSSSGFTQVKALLVKTLYGFELTGNFCECQSTAIINVDVQNWNGTCACKTDSKDVKLTKVSSMYTPNNSILSAK